MTPNARSRGLYVAGRLKGPPVAWFESLDSLTLALPTFPAGDYWVRFVVLWSTDPPTKLDAIASGPETDFGVFRLRPNGGWTLQALPNAKGTTP